MNYLNMHQSFIFSEHWQFIKDYRIVMAQFPAEDCMRDIQNGRVYQKFIQHDPCARGKKVLSIVVSSAPWYWSPLLNIEALSVHTTPMLNSTSFSRVLGHGSLALTSAFIFEAFIAHPINLFSASQSKWWKN